MKPVRFILLVSAAILTAAATDASRSPRSAPSSLELFGPKAVERAGLAKLTPDERDALDALLVEVPVLDHIQSSAEQYLLRDGWEIIALYGAFHSRTDRRSYQFAALGSSALLLRPVFDSEVLVPGFYLVEKTGSSLDILAPSGETVDYWIEEEL